MARQAARPSVRIRLCFLRYERVALTLLAGSSRPRSLSPATICVGVITEAEAVSTAITASVSSPSLRSPSAAELAFKRLSSASIPWIRAVARLRTLHWSERSRSEFGDPACCAHPEILKENSPQSTFGSGSLFLASGPQK